VSGWPVSFCPPASATPSSASPEQLLSRTQHQRVGSTSWRSVISWKLHVDAQQHEHAAAAPLATMLLMRCAAASKVARELATTSPGTARHPRPRRCSPRWNEIFCEVHLDHVFHVLVRSAKRCSMWSVSVQMRLDTSCWSKSARCIKSGEVVAQARRVEDREGEPCPAALPVNMRSIVPCIMSTAWARPAPRPSTSTAIAEDRATASAT